jgi:hypothetical protein
LIKWNLKMKLNLKKKGKDILGLAMGIKQSTVLEGS